MKLTQETYELLVELLKESIKSRPEMTQIYLDALSEIDTIGTY